jgi:hypothetical protein
MTRLDYYDILPAGMDAYLSNYGWHFSKPMCEWAVSKMRDRNGDPVKMKTKEEVDTILKRNNIEIENDHGYDKVFVMHMGLTDYFGSSVVDEAHLAKYVKDVLDDEDGYDGVALTRFLADCNAKGIPIVWQDVI